MSSRTFKLWATERDAMTDPEANISDVVAKKAFIITMVGAALFIGSAFIFVIL